MEGEPDPEAVDETVHRQAGGTERSHVMVRAGVFLVVSVVEHERTLGQEERQKPGTDEPRHVPRVSDGVDRLRQDVEEGDGDHDAAGQCDQGLQLALDSERDIPPRERRAGRERSKRDRPPGRHSREPIVGPERLRPGGRGAGVANSSDGAPTPRPGEPAGRTGRLRRDRRPGTVDAADRIGDRVGSPDRTAERRAADHDHLVRASRRRAGDGRRLRVSRRRVGGDRAVDDGERDDDDRRRTPVPVRRASSRASPSSAARSPRTPSLRALPPGRARPARAATQTAVESRTC